MPHLTADWVGVQLPFARSHAHRFTEQICYLTKHPNTVLCLAHTWLADQDGILSPDALILIKPVGSIRHA